MDNLLNPAPPALLGMLHLLLVLFAAMLAAPAVHRLARSRSGAVLALLPLALTLHFATHVGPVSAGGSFTYSADWVPSLGVRFSLHLDGLSLLMSLLITGVGALVVLYSGRYLEGHPHLGRFYASLFLFMGSMLGVVLADNVVTLFVFWEMTSLASYFLIGFHHERPEARRAALQALLVTGLGGLALLVGLLLLGRAGGTFELSELSVRGDLLRSHASYLPALLLVLVGAFAKSAQFPFHFWLPNAMEAPTPVSAYLHAATMVKAGVYLLARLSPALGSTDAWLYGVAPVGGATMLLGSLLALRSTDLKRILAYSTVGALGTLTLLLGLGTPSAAGAAVAFLLAHAFYKGALFLVAGAVDHAAGSRDATRLGGLGRAMPVTAAAAGLAALSMAGLPLLAGSAAKESLYHSVLESSPWLAAATLSCAAMLAGVAFIAGLRPFLGRAPDPPLPAHEPPPSLWLGPALLAGCGLAAGLLSGAAGALLLSPAASSVLGRPEALHLPLLPAPGPEAALSAASVAAGALLAAKWARVRSALERLGPLLRWGPEALYEGGLRGLNGLARAQTRLLQHGHLRFYLLAVLAASGLLGWWALLGPGPSLPPGTGSGTRLHELLLAALILGATLAATLSRSALGAVAALGIAGYGVGVLYLLFGAPDLALTQVAVETLALLLFVRVLYHMPDLTRRSLSAGRLRDAAAALAVGALMSLLALGAVAAEHAPAVSGYFLENSVALGHGRNVVNVILVDFRALDTLGEITVLGIAGIGVYALLRLRPGGKEAP